MKSIKHSKLQAHGHSLHSKSNLSLMLGRGLSGHFFICFKGKNSDVLLANNMLNLGHVASNYLNSLPTIIQKEFLEDFGQTPTIPILTEIFELF